MYATRSKNSTTINWDWPTRDVSRSREPLSVGSTCIRAAMWRLEFTSLILVCAIRVSTQAITTRVEEMRIIYPPQVRSERNLAVCETREVCSVLHRRFWLRPVVERLCRCPTGQECPLALGHDNQTMALSNRSQMKFCQSIAELPECGARDAAVSVSVRNTTERASARQDKTVSSQRTLVTADCRCLGHHHLKHHRDTEARTRNGTTTVSKLYRCGKLRKCLPQEFCGNARSDYFSTYYSCSCPTGHMCVFRNRTQVLVHELLYDGPAFEAACFKYL